MIIKYISLILGAIFEIYCISTFMNTFCDIKTLKKSIKLILFTLILIFHSFISCFTEGIILSILAFITTYFISLLYKSKQYIKIILCIVISIINIAAEQLFGVVFMLITQKNHIEINITPESYAMGILLSKFIVFVIILIIKSGRVIFNITYISMKYLILLSILPITTIVLGFFMSQIILSITDNTQKIIYIILNILLILSNAITFEIIRKQNELAKAKYEYRFLKENINEQTKHYSELQISQEELRQMRHNMKSTYLALIAEIEKGNLDAAINHMKADLNILNKSNKLIDTGHPAIDTIFENKLNRCNELGIYTNISYSLETQINVSEIEIAIVIGNILDNAIEACKKLTSEDKEIWGLISSDSQNITIDIKNTAKDSNNFKTSKSNKALHGIGLKSISHIAKKYNGYARFSFKNNEFTTFVIFDN